LPEQLFELEILRVYLGAMAANLRMSSYPDSCWRDWMLL
jgi:hypothetical protein